MRKGIRKYYEMLAITTLEHYRRLLKCRIHQPGRELGHP